MSGILTIAELTWREASRRRILPVCFVLGLLFLGLYALSVYSIDGIPGGVIVRRQVFKPFLTVGLYAVSWLAGMTIVVASADSLPAEMSSGVMQTIASKPIARWKVFFGKWLAFATIAACYVGLMTLGCTLIVHDVSGYWPRFLLEGSALIWLECLVLLTITISVGVRLSTMAAGATAIGLHGIAFLGSWMEIFGHFAQNANNEWVGLVTSLIVPTEALFRRAAYEFESPILLGFIDGPFGLPTVPSGLMVGYSLLYIAAVFCWGLQTFNRRDL